MYGSVGEQDTVQMVRFVLEDDRCIARDPLRSVGAPESPVVYGNLLRAYHRSDDARNGEASLLSGGRVVPVAGYLRIDVQFERFARFVETLYGDETAQDTYLRCGDAYALVRGVTYGRQHAGDQPFELLRVQHSVVQRFRLGTQKEGVVAVVHGEQAHRAAGVSYQCLFFVREASVGCFRSACGEGGAGQQQGGRSENGGWLVHGSFFVVVHCRLACCVPAVRLAPSTG